MILFNSSSKIIDVVILDSKLFFQKVASVAAAVNTNGMKTLLANGLSTFLIKAKSVFSYDPKSLPRNPPDCRILCN